MDSTLILLVEDNTDARVIVSTYLRHSGFTVAEARDGSEALRMTRELQPALVLMDLSMPRMDGWAALEALRSDQKTAHVPVVALTAHSMEGDAQRIMDAGFDSYLAKPLDPQGMVTEIRRMLQN